MLMGCRDWMDDEGRGTAVPGPGPECICAQACGVRVVNGSYWVDAAGKSHALGACYPVHDELLYGARAGCQCDRFAAPSPPPFGGRPSPNH